ncbi:putative membrane protein [Rhizobium tibeticum]|uniref:DUF2231 domain-containing protein n=1 Tax=Rhizobium tibeticum TaxID=501024 RepID=UPI0027879D96|nr:DUF2231 domain-containing protein [Rhizobium tibeticum]MDP9810145.1 putative membrane protein [Rhizobium tibeticum]
MSYSNLPLARRAASPSSVSAVPLHFSATCFIGTLVADLAYWLTAELTWANFSDWLLVSGLLLSLIAGVAIAIDLLRGAITMTSAISWLYIAGLGLAFILSVLNALVHSRDGWTSVVPTGLALSAATFIAIVISAICSPRVRSGHRQERL